jgi:hypothetical protein
MPTIASRISPLTPRPPWHALAEIARLVAVAQLDRLECAPVEAPDGTAARPASRLRGDVDLDRRVAAAVEDLAGDDVDNGGHGASPPGIHLALPVTGQPDFAHLVIDYVPGGWLVESKSLKLYLTSFRNHGAFHEDCTVAIAKRLVSCSRRNGCASAATGIRAAASRSTCSGRRARCPRASGCPIRACALSRAGLSHKRIMQRKPDKHFRRICRFFDTTARRCGIYQARPAACRAFPGQSRCGYYDFLSFERDAQNDPEYVSTTRHAED